MLSLAVRNFTRNLRRYRVLLFSLSLAVAALVVLIGLLEGVQTSVRQKASRYFAGDITLQPHRGSDEVHFESADAIYNIITELELPAQSILRRSVYIRTDATLFFAGAYVNQRRVAGVDWASEKQVLGSMDFASGGLPTMRTNDIQTNGLATTSNAALISTAVAESLGARVGDELILSLTTQFGQRNTVPLVVAGIYDEHSFFGYTVYMDRATLNAAQEYPLEDVSSIGLHLHSYRNQARVSDTLHTALSEAVSVGAIPSKDGVFPVWNSRDERSADRRSAADGERQLGIMTLEAQLDEITNLLQALSLIAGAAVLVFLLIIVVGVTNTYVMITYERTREIGTLRALGLSRAGTLRLLLTEALIMAACSVVIGIPLGFGVLEGIHRGLDLSDNVYALLFLVQGRIAYQVPPTALPVIFVAVAAAALLGCLKPALRAALMPPSGALQQE